MMVGRRHTPGIIHQLEAEGVLEFGRMDPHFDKIAVSKSLEEICNIFDWPPAATTAAAAAAAAATAETSAATSLPIPYIPTKKRSIEEVVAEGGGFVEAPAHVYSDGYFQRTEGLVSTTKKRGIIQQL
jgi:hypothetical protein